MPYPLMKPRPGVFSIGHLRREDVAGRGLWSSLLTAFLIMGLFPAGGRAECAYFRVSMNLLQCKTVDAKAAQAVDPYPAPSEDPELETPITKTFVRMDCECQYSLMGADVRCDPDQTLEKSSVIGVDDPGGACRRGRTLCRDVCPARLP